jgi:hypothetical protein
VTVEKTCSIYFAAATPPPSLGVKHCCPIPLPARFAIHFYYALMQSTPISTAVVQARRELLNKESNPIGLFYTLYGNPLLRIKHPLANTNRPLTSSNSSPAPPPTSRRSGWRGGIFRGFRPD